MINLFAFILILAMVSIAVITTGGKVATWYILGNLFLLLIQVPFIIMYFADKR